MKKRTSRVPETIPEAVGYPHRLRNGFPVSLSGKGRGKPSALALARSRGLTTKLIKELLSEVPLKKWIGQGPTKDRDADMGRMLEISGFRASCFWRVVEEDRPPLKALTCAIEATLLSDFVPTWQLLELDSSILRESCSEWASIERAVGALMGRPATARELGVFMVWPQLLQRLDQWATLGERERDIAAKAVFALSSIAASDWFIRRAIELCPELSDELGHLLTPLPKPSPAEPGKLMAEPNGDAIKVDAQPHFDQGLAAWNGLRSQLESLHEDWTPTPKRFLIERISGMAREAAALADQLPPDIPPPRELVEQRITVLVSRLNDVRADVAMGWLGDDAMVQITARWHGAIADTTDDGEIVRLADDCGSARARLDTSVAKFVEAASVVATQQSQIELLEVEALAATTLARLGLSSRLGQSKGALLAAERTRDEAALAVLAAASPFGNTFDPSVDYASPLNAERAPPGADSPAPDFVAAASGRAPAADSEPKATATQGPAVAGAPLAITGKPGRLLGDGPAIAEHWPPENPQVIEAQNDHVAGTATSPREGGAHVAVGDSPEIEQLPAPTAVPVANDLRAAPLAPDLLPAMYTEDAGDRCRPIWSLIAARQYAIAFRYASDLAVQDPSIHVPPPELLRCLTLAAGLSSSESPLVVALANAYTDLKPAWFEDEEAPASWRTALSMLLIAATLRPMVLAPSTGAATVAAYRHLDKRHATVLELVRRVAEISARLQGFSVGPGVLQVAAGDAALRAQVQSAAKAAHDWLRDRAPNKKIRFLPASKVWQEWLKAGEVIHELLAPIERGDPEARASVRAATEALGQYDVFLERLNHTDRQTIERRGQDIEAGARDHLWAATCEAVALANEWLSLADLATESGDRLRELVGQLRMAFQTHQAKALSELDLQWPGDDWRLVASACAALQTEIAAIGNLFTSHGQRVVVDAGPEEQLSRDLLRVSGLRVGPEWSPEGDAASRVSAIDAWLKSPAPVDEVVRTRLDRGDLHSAELLLEEFSDGNNQEALFQQIERSREQWQKEARRRVTDARRGVEIGLAYGHLADDERAACESALSSVEGRLQDGSRFDILLDEIAVVSEKVNACKAKRVSEAQRAFDRELPRMSADVATELQFPLDRSDVHTFNELLERVRRGVPPWPERIEYRDAFPDFYPEAQREVFAWLSAHAGQDVERAMQTGGAIGPVAFAFEGDSIANKAAADLYSTWSLMASRRRVSEDGLKKLFALLGFTVRSARASDSNMTGAVAWSIETAPIEDREICPVPHFGSGAAGRYRLLCVWDPLTPEEILQRVGEEGLHTATIVLYLGRLQPRMWAELGRSAKERRRSFLILDEVLLIFLAAQSGSRLAAWFNVALPFTHSEPYDASAGYVPPEMFYGRSSELESVRMAGGCYFIYGGRQLGKTALLRRAAKTFHDPAADRFSGWIDLLGRGIGERRRVTEVWVCIAEKLREIKVLGSDFPLPNPAKPGSVEALIAAVKAFLTAKSGRRILLLLDEADRFFEQDAREDSNYTETRRLKQLMDETDRRFKVVFAGLHNVLRTVSASNQPLGHFNEAVRIGPLMEEREIRAAEELITRPMAAAGFQFNDRSLVMRILAQTNYYPSLIQLYCTQLLKHLREIRVPNRSAAGPRFSIEETDIETVFASRPLRDAIRGKFRLTLQLDDRYEVIGNALGLEALGASFDHAEGIDWRKLWADCATAWWPEGFKSTSERDFIALLEEMVQLGVLSDVRPDHYSLRNPNVMLLLGSKQEIERTLSTSREPRIEFQTTIFRPALEGSSNLPARNPLTYRQLDEVMRLRNSVLMVAGSQASGIGRLVDGLRDQSGGSEKRGLVILDKSADANAFKRELDREAESTRRVEQGVTVMFVPPGVPWTPAWVKVAKAKADALTSKTSFVSIVFSADAARLWSIVSTNAPEDRPSEPWQTLLPWDRGFVAKWLEDLQLATDADVIERLTKVTGLWGGLLEELASSGDGPLGFARRLDQRERNLQDTQPRELAAAAFTGGIVEVQDVLAALAGLGDGVTASDLVEYEGVAPALVEQALAWAELLGIAKREAGNYWSLNPYVRSTTVAAAA